MSKTTEALAKMAFGLDADERKMLESLIDGKLHTIPVDLYVIGERLHNRGLVFFSNGTWPDMDASITFAGRKALRRNETLAEGEAISDALGHVPGIHWSCR